MMLWKKNWQETEKISEMGGMRDRWDEQRVWHP